MKIAAQLFTVREYTQTPEDIYETLKKIKAIGYDAFQMSAFGPIDPSLLKEYMEELELTMCVTHTNPNRILNDTEAVIAEHKLWNCPYIGIGAMPLERMKLSGYLEFTTKYRPALEKIHEAGLQFVYHNHRFEFEKFENTENGIECMTNHLPPELFGLLPDFFWIAAAGVNPIDFLTRYQNRIKVVHFKDMAVIQDQMVMAEIGYGNMNYASIALACEQAGVEWVCVEQDTCRRDPFESLAMSLNYLKTLPQF